MTTATCTWTRRRSSCRTSTRHRRSAGARGRHPTSAPCPTPQTGTSTTWVRQPPGPPGQTLPREAGMRPGVLTSGTGGGRRTGLPGQALHGGDALARNSVFAFCGLDHKMPAAHVSGVVPGGCVLRPWVRAGRGPGRCQPCGVRRWNWALPSSAAGFGSAVELTSASLLDPCLGTALDPVARGSRVQ